MHRDIKTANFLVFDNEKNIKISDFGVSKIYTNTVYCSSTLTGSPIFMSPGIIYIYNFNLQIFFVELF